MGMNNIWEQKCSFFIHFPLYIIWCLVGWHLDSSRGGTQTLVEGSGGVIVDESTKGTTPWPTTTSITTSSTTTTIVLSCWIAWQSLPPLWCLSLLLCQTLTWYGMMRWRNPTFVTIYDSWHTRLPRWCHHHARICGGHSDPLYPFYDF